MALPIQPTPVLKGKEARDFIKKAEANKTKRVSKKVIEKAVKIFLSVMKRNPGV